ncbi:MAG: glycosyltransferase family 4 protein [Planctomycetes bacterium]|nr:glycosyltransferase family 4 protein [Planctomycetota bacterium]
MAQHKPQGAKLESPRLIHMTTVPMSLSFLEGQIEYVKDKGFDVHVISAPDETLDEFGDLMQVKTHELPMERRITPLRDLWALLRLTKILRQLRPHIVHGHTPKGGLLSMLGSWWCGTPVRIYHIHGLPLVTATGIKRLLLKWTEKTSCRFASQVYCVSDSVRKVAISEGLCPAEKVKVLLNGSINGIDAAHRFNPDRFDANTRDEVRQKYGIPADAIVIGFVGRIVRDKGMIELAQAWKTLRQEVPNAHMLLVGGFEPQDPIPADVERELQTDERIHMAGWLGAADIPNLCTAMDVLALPSYREGFNTVLLEAAAMRLPVVASRVPGCIEGVVEGQTGALVPAYDFKALAEAIKVYLQDADLRKRHGHAGRERVLRDFRPEDMSAAIYQEYVQLLAEKGFVVSCAESAQAKDILHQESAPPPIDQRAQR